MKTNKVEAFLRKREKPSKKEKKVRFVCSLILIDIIVWGVVFTSLPPSASFTYENPSPLILEASAAVVVEERPMSIEEKIKSVFGADSEKALKIARCESQLNHLAVGDHKIAYVKHGKEYGKSYGIFQIRSLPGRPEPAELFNAEFNIEYAYQVYQKQGWEAWRWCNHNS